MNDFVDKPLAFWQESCLLTACLPLWCCLKRFEPPKGDKIGITGEDLRQGLSQAPRIAEIHLTT